MWINHDLAALGLQYVYLRDGDYLRIALPPGGDRVDQVATRCLATALHQGMDIDDVLDRQTMFTLGWYDEVVPHPWVPLHQEESEPDHMNLMQTQNTILPPLPSVPSCLKESTWSILGQNLPEHLKMRLEHELPDYSTVPSPGQAARIEPLAPIFDQPAAIQELFHLRQQDTAEGQWPEDNEYEIDTWYLDMIRHEQCHEARRVSLGGPFTNWIQRLADAWDDLIDRAWPLNLQLVRPRPPATSWNPRPKQHLIIYQRAEHGRTANLFTTIRCATNYADQGIRQIASFAPHRMNKGHVVLLQAITQLAIQKSQICNAQFGMVNKNYAIRLRFSIDMVYRLRLLSNRLPLQQHPPMSGMKNQKDWSSCNIRRSNLTISTSLHCSYINSSDTQLQSN